MAAMATAMAMDIISGLRPEPFGGGPCREPVSYEHAGSIIVGRLRCRSLDIGAGGGMEFGFFHPGKRRLYR